MELWIAYRYTDEDKLQIGMISKNKFHVERFASENEMSVECVIDGETFPVI